jgi:membrane-associated phospholipid phosphatase
MFYALRRLGFIMGSTGSREFVALQDAARARGVELLIHGIPRSGDAWDSFPSGHALHLGAIAGPLSRLVSKRLRPYVWAGLLGLASTRIMLLAHYASDVVAGLVLGAGLGKAVRKITE